MIRAPHLGRGSGPTAKRGEPDAPGTWFGRVSRLLFGGGDGAEPSDKVLLDETIEAVVDAVEPRIRLRPRYRTWLVPGTQRTIAYLRALAHELPEPIALERAAWNDDARLNAWFATPDRVRECIGESAELRGYFRDNAGADSLCALLAMRYGERTVLGHAVQGELLVREAAQTHVSFFEHRLLAPGGGLAESRREVGRRILLRLAQLALRGAMAETRNVAELEQDKAMLGMRLRIARLARDGAGTLTGKSPPSAEAIAAMERELEALSRDHLEAKRGAGSLDRYLEQLDQVLSRPEQHVALARASLAVDRMGVKHPPGANPEAREIERAELRLGEGLAATIAFVVVPRAELPPETDAVAEAARRMGLPP